MHLLKNMFRAPVDVKSIALNIWYFPLLVFKGIYHRKSVCFFPRALERMDGTLARIQSARKKGGGETKTHLPQTDSIRRYGIEQPSLFQ